MSNGGIRVLEDAHDSAAHAVRTTLTNAAVDISVSAFTDSIAIADDAGNKATVTEVGGKQGLDVNVVDITLNHVGDSVRLGNGTDYITSTNSGGKNALDVSVNGGTISQAPSGITVLEYSSINVVSGGTGTILSYIVPAGIYIQKVYLSGDSIGRYTLKKNGVPQMVYRMSQTQYSANFDLATSTAWGLQADIGDIISVEVRNQGSQPADFDATLQNLQT